MSGTKHELALSDIQRVCEEKLDGVLMQVYPLADGLCNALYLLEFSNGHKAVLKASSPDKKGLRRGEQWLMDSELAALNLMKNVPGIPVPQVIVQDNSGKVLDAPYFIMEYIEGISMGNMKKEWPDTEKTIWNHRIGRLARSIASFSGESFGILASGRTFSTFMEFFQDFLSMLIMDAEDGRIDLGVSSDKLYSRLSDSRSAMEEVTEPKLVHYDLWENNLIVRKDRIVGVLDWERAMYSDPLMEERFRNYAIHPSFLMGYGKTEFTSDERERCLWYDMAMDAAPMIEVFYRQYDDTKQYDRARDRFLFAWRKLNGIC